MSIEKLSFKALFYSAFSFSFSDKRQLTFNLLSFMLPFLLFFPTLFTGLSVQSSFLPEYQTLHALEQDDYYSLYYMMSESYLSNTSNIPSDLLKNIDKDVTEIISYSNLEGYITDRLMLCKAEMQFFAQGTFAPLTALFLENETLMQASKYFVFETIPVAYNEVILVRNTDLPTDEYDYSYAIGDNISILPFSLEIDDVFINNTFLINPLNASISNYFSVNDFLLEGRLSTENPFLHHALSSNLESISQYPLLLAPIDYLTDFFHYFPALLYSEISINVQFLYDFSSFKISQLKDLYKTAENLPKLSGPSYYHGLFANVSPELAEFMAAFKSEIRQQWFRLIAIGLLVTVFSIAILWFSVSTNILKTSDIYTNFLTRGFSRKTILKIFSVARFLELALSAFGALLFAFPITYGNLAIITLLLKSHFLPLQLISFTTVFLPSLLFFIIIFGFSLISLVILLKQVEASFPNRLSSISTHTKNTSKMQLLIFSLMATFGLIGLTSFLLIKRFLSAQEDLTSSLSFILNIFSYLFIAIVVVCVLFILINILLLKVVTTAQALWEKVSKKFSILLHNLSFAFRHQRKQSFFIGLFFLILLQSFILPAYLTQHAANSARFMLGSDVSFCLEQPSITETFISDVSSLPSVSSTANYSFIQLTIYNVVYQVLVVSPTFGSTVAYTKEYHLGITKNSLEKFCNRTNAILTQSKDYFLNNRIEVEQGDNLLTLGINNLSASENEFINVDFTVLGTFDRFPILLNDQELMDAQYEEGRTVPFLVMTEGGFKTILLHQKDISIVRIEEAVLVKLEKQIEVKQFLQEVETLGYSYLPTTWIDLYPKYLPTFSTSIFALSITSGVFATISFFITNIVLTREELNNRREKILVLRYRGTPIRNISKGFLLEYLLLLVLMFPIGCAAGIGTLTFLLKILVKADNWVLEVPYFSKISVCLSVLIVVIIGIDVSIRYFYLKKFLNFQPSIREET